MTAQLINGNALAKQLRAEATQYATVLTTRGHQPDLAVILVDEDSVGQVYVRSKIKTREDNGFLSGFDCYSADLSEADLFGRIDALSHDPCVHGILVQLPLPKHIDSHKVLETIAPEKDMDGFHVADAGTLMTGALLFRPCTPYGCMKMLESINYPVRGANAAVVDASSIVGKPMAMLLLRAGATITICNSETRDLVAHTRKADITMAAVGHRNIITADMVKPDTIVIDVGMNRDGAGKLCGGADFVDVKEVAGYTTPVPSGAGPMTVTMLLINTLETVEHAAEGAALAA